ncbi:MAG: HAMP domain-containing sensor histidine kinase, partial [Spirochaetaceae bacterium]|nr:HAMP domain-containing sensor histidine kinase [Spirochaetaceae bacterium]
RIRSHGDRANRIVHDMLMMGRHSAEVLKVEINGLLEEYARLAYHSARASDPEFQLDITYDLDPQMGELLVIPQDLGRVFLNMVANACDATDEKRRGGGAGEQEGSPYEPTLSIASKREDERAVIRIKDNADGMPAEVVEKIFTPFFTTKPAGKGTGLGLAMSADIVREHGGTIQVNTEPGRFTEMVIELPLEPPASLGVAEEEA